MARMRTTETKGKTNEELRSDIARLTEETKDLRYARDQAVSTANLNQQVAEELEAELYTLKEQLKSAKDAELSKQQENALRCEIERLQDDLADAQLETEHRDKIIAVFEKSLADQKQLFNELAAERANITLPLPETVPDQHLEEFEAMATALTEHQSTISKLQDRIRELEEELAEDKDDLIRKENEIISLSNEIQEARQYISSLELHNTIQAPKHQPKGCSLFAEFDDRRTEQEQDMQKLADKNATLTRRVRAISAQCERLATELSNSKHKSGAGSFDNAFVQSLCNELTERSDRISEKDSIIARLEKELATANTSQQTPVFKSFQLKIHDLKQKLIIAQSERDKFYDENVSLKKRIVLS